MLLEANYPEYSLPLPDPGGGGDEVLQTLPGLTALQVEADQDKERPQGHRQQPQLQQPSDSEEEGLNNLPHLTDLHLFSARIRIWQRVLNFCSAKL